LKARVLSCEPSPAKVICAAVSRGRAPKATVNAHPNSSQDELSELAAGQADLLRAFVARRILSPLHGKLWSWGQRKHGGNVPARMFAGEHDRNRQQDPDPVTTDGAADE